MRKVAVLMATYNGARFIREQIDSILCQTYKDFDLIIRDDGSSDETIDIIGEYLKYSNITLIENNTGIHGQRNNFGKLFRYAVEKGYDEILFSDQDDIWYADKIQISLEHLRKYEGPALVTTNIENWSMTTNRSAVEIDKIYSCSFESLLVQNWFWGCTMALNSGLIKLVKDIPGFIENHDYWVALVASFFEVNIDYIEEPSMKHRLHDRNVTAADGARSFKGRIAKIKNELLKKEFRQSKYQEWDELYEYFKEYENNKHLLSLEKLYHARGIRGAFNVYKAGYRGMHARGTCLMLGWVLLR